MQSAERGVGRGQTQPHGAVVLFEQVQRQCQKHVARMVDEELLVAAAVAIRIEHMCDLAQFAHAQGRLGRDVAQRIPAMRAAVRGKGVEDEDFLADLPAVAAGERVVFVLDVEHHHAAGVIEQHWNHNAHALARASWCSQQDGALSVVAQVASAMTSDQHAGVGATEDAGACQMRATGKTGIAVGAAGRCAPQCGKQAQPEQGGQAQPAGAGQSDGLGMGLVAGVFQQPGIGPPGAPACLPVLEVEPPVQHLARRPAACGKQQGQAEQCEGEAGGRLHVRAGEGEAMRRQATRTVERRFCSSGSSR